MLKLRCEVVRWVDDEPFPGWVEAQFTDAAGRRWSVFDKPPIFAAVREIDADSTYPVEAFIACVVLDGHGPRECEGTVVVSTSPHGVATPDERDEFTVRRDQLIR